MVPESRKATGIARKRRASAALDQVGRPLVDVEHVQVDVVEPVAVGERAGQLVGAQGAALHQRLADRAAVVPRVGDGRLDHVSFGEPELDDDVAEPPPLVRVAGRRDGPGLPGAR